MNLSVVLIPSCPPDCHVVSLVARIVYFDVLFSICFVAHLDLHYIIPTRHLAKHFEVQLDSRNQEMMFRKCIHFMIHFVWYVLWNVSWITTIYATCCSIKCTVNKTFIVHYIVHILRSDTERAMDDRSNNVALLWGVSSVCMYPIILKCWMLVLLSSTL